MNVCTHFADADAQLKLGIGLIPAPNHRSAFGGGGPKTCTRTQ